MSDTSKGPDWWLASDGKWYPPESRPTAPPPPPRMERWELNQAQLRWKAENRKGLRHRWNDLTLKLKVVVVAAFVVTAAVLTAVTANESSKTEPPARYLKECRDAAGIQMSSHGMDLDPKNPAVVLVFDAYTNRCLAEQAGADPCGLVLRASDKPVAGCGEYSYLPLAGFRSLIPK